MMDPLSTIDVLILDFDGVVIESNDIKTKAFEKLFSRFPEHVKTMMEFHHENVSVSRIEKFDFFLKLTGRSSDFEFKNKIAVDFSKFVLDEILTIPLVNGVQAFINQLKGRFPIYLASVTPMEELLYILHMRKMSGWFTGVYGCPPWIKSEAISDIILKEQCMPDRALLIGDSPGDQDAASETGIQFIARNSNILFKKPPRLIFDDMEEIEQSLKNNEK